MGIAIDLVKQGRAGAALSAGNTGAMMAMAKLSLRTLKGIDRPALAALLPTLGDNDVVMLDLGANTECDPRNLVEFAVMGAAYSRIALGVERPRVGLLNIGSEELKGTDEIRDAAAILREAHLQLNFTGFVEGDKLSRGDVDVIVCDGFSGNIALKTIEGTARFVADLLRRGFSSSFRSKMGFLISRPATELLKHHLDPNNHNGAVFLGLNGIVVKSHGSASDKGVANAIGVAAKLAAQDITRRITEDLDQFPGHLTARGQRGMRRAAVLGTGSALPKRRVSNAELAETVDTSDEWIVARTGIKFRHIAGDDETTATLGADAARDALNVCGPRCERDRPDRAGHGDTRSDFPGERDQGSGDARHQRLRRIRRRGGVFGLPLRLVGRRKHDPWRRRDQRAGHRVRDVQPHSRLGRSRHLCAVRRRRGRGGARGQSKTGAAYWRAKLHADGRHNELLYVDGGVSTTGTVGKLRMKGPEVFKHAVTNLAAVLGETLAAADLSDRGCRLGRAASGECAHPRCHRTQIGA